MNEGKTMNEAQREIRPSQEKRNRAAAVTGTVKRVAATAAKEWAATGPGVRWGAYIVAAIVLLAALTPLPAPAPKTARPAPKAAPVYAPKAAGPALDKIVELFQSRAPWGSVVQVAVVAGLHATQALVSSAYPGQYTLMLVFRGGRDLRTTHCAGHSRIRASFYRYTTNRIVHARVAAAPAEWMKSGSMAYFTVSAWAPWNIAVVSCRREKP